MELHKILEVPVRHGVACVPTLTTVRMCGFHQRRDGHALKNASWFEPDVVQSKRARRLQVSICQGQCCLSLPHR